ncbi:cation-transporting P-type ATPase [Kutzneria sp. 744]|uniref:cation-translocating P-type ATPase n=1 Tax=Kutzneria sp. (strain 744) TaxID=345341 RepID=UPI0003EEABDF|nr:cation-transporting P-type ATPase [Kutzneria sp. 744]EWM13629.1 calcium-translocating P-type ATPase, PMCA-type [Kutzneria sp. 744]
MTRRTVSTPFHTLSVADVLRTEGVDRANGLSAAQATARLQVFGPNRFAEERRQPWPRAFVRQYADPMQIVLLVAGICSMFPLRQYGTGALLLLLTLFNAVLGLHQEGKAVAAVAALQKMTIAVARVRRDGTLVELPADQLVPGDLVLIEAGDMVPADGRLVRAARLEIDESALTGESVPVVKGVDPVDRVDTDLGDRTDMVYLNTAVTRGAGEFVVTATGMTTEVGHISGMLCVERGVQTPLTRQLARLTNQILVIAGIALLLSVVVNLTRGLPFSAVFTAATAFAIAAIPTGLPVVVTTLLSLGTQSLAGKHAIVKQLRSTETLGCTSAINSDKTGTMTLNQMTAVELAIPGRRYSVGGTGYSTRGRITHVAGQPEVDLEPFLLPMVLASDAVVSDGELVGDPTEGALVVLAEKGGLDAKSSRERFPRIAEVPFDAAYKLMATFHRMTDESGKDIVRCFVKGAPDRLLARAATTVDDDFRARYLAENRRLGERGLRVLATARKDFDHVGFDPNADLLALLDGLTLLALVGIVDPPRPNAREAIATAKSAGIRVRMITGDHVVTAEAIARELGIEGRAVVGAEFGALSDDEALEQVEDIGVVARVTPEHKVRLVEVLQRKGDVVAMTGDGVNDAPALRKADIGIAMGITGTEVSKEAATMIITDDDFSTIVRAVELGRGLYDNLTRYVRFQMGALVGFVVTFLGASILNLAAGIPFLPTQTLWANFTTQMFQAIGLGSGKPADGLMLGTPRPADEPIVPRGVLAWLGVAGLVLGASTLLVIWWAGAAHGLDVARTMGLTTFSISELFFSFTIRSGQRSMFSLDTFDDRRFRVTTAMSVAAIVLATEFGLFQKILHTISLDLGQWLACVVAAAPIILVSELYKALLRRRSGASAAGTAGPGAHQERCATPPTCVPAERRSAGT